MRPPVDNPFVFALRVSDDDVDEQGRVSNVTIVRWMSEAAFAHSAALGFDLARYRQLGAWFVVKRHEIDYHAAATAGDELVLYTWPSALKKVTAERRHHLVRRADGALIAAGLNVWAFIDAATGRPVRIPDEAREAFDPRRFVGEDQAAARVSKQMPTS